MAETAALLVDDILPEQPIQIQLKTDSEQEYGLSPDRQVFAVFEHW